MARHFNTTGICFPDWHYMLPPLPRVAMLRRVIEERSYFVLHAPRQSGKSTALLALAQDLTQSGRYASVLLSMETGEPFPDDIGAAEDVMLDAWRRKASRWLPADLQPPPWPAAPAGGRIGAALAAWARASPRPLVLFLDEIDSLQDATLRSVLRQIRDGFWDRPDAFPSSVGLCGMRDVRDYKIASGGSPRLNSASPFNIKVSVTLKNFTRDEVAALYAQHTAETGQAFGPAAVDAAYRLSCGQPWLVNALADVMVEELAPDRVRALTEADVLAAKEVLIQRRDTHLDSLIERLREPRVKRIIEPILVGAYPQMDMMNDDLVYVRDMGLITDRPSVRIANPIYQELIPRALTSSMQALLPHQPAWYVSPHGSLDMDALLRAFQRFFAEQSEAWLGRFDYQEAGPHLMLMAFLQRIVQGGLRQGSAPLGEQSPLSLPGGGTIQREFALGSGRADLLVCHGGERHALELKIRRGAHTLQEGIDQLSGYLDRLGERRGFLILFDRGERPWEEKLFESEATGPGGQQIRVFGM